MKKQVKAKKKLDENGNEFLKFPKNSGLYQNECGQTYMTLPNGEEFELFDWMYKEDGSRGTREVVLLDEAKDSLRWYLALQNAIEVNLTKTIVLLEDFEGPTFFVKKGKIKLLKALYSRDHHFSTLAVVVQDEKGSVSICGGTYFQEAILWREEEWGQLD